MLAYYILLACQLSKTGQFCAIGVCHSESSDKAHDRGLEGKLADGMFEGGFLCFGTIKIALYAAAVWTGENDGEIIGGQLNTAPRLAVDQVVTLNATTLKHAS